MRLWSLVLLVFASPGLTFGTSQVPFSDNARVRSSQKDDGISSLLSALSTMQSEFFEAWLGTWPDAIDWTRAVMGTHIAASTHTFTKSRTSVDEAFSLQDENIINGYFSHLIAYYFGQDSLSLRLQAYDDMLWVVLGWLDTIQLSTRHSNAHFPPPQQVENPQANCSAWYGTSFTPAFAHRARIFWELAAQGWDEELCGGGMIWSPWLTPYKNAITNELFIAASINMYLYFPGDDNEFPFSSGQEKTPPAQEDAHDRKFLDAAIKGYDWLVLSNMTDDQGLFFDGFHVRGWSKDGDIGTGKCDVPDKMVYTYNQGVILSAQRGLWSATGELKYLIAGHELIHNVISATGWSTEKNAVISTEWSGLGRNGVLEEACDSGGYCSQDGQTFKGIFFHHLTVFCQALAVGRQPLPLRGTDRFTARLHLQSCLEYAPWIERNAEAAMGTKDDKGVFGMWWTVGLTEDDEVDGGITKRAPESKLRGVDYRNQGVPDDKMWKETDDSIAKDRFRPGKRETSSRDPNERGRGRTVETHSGGVAVLRARAEFHALQSTIE